MRLAQSAVVEVFRIDRKGEFVGEMLIMDVKRTAQATNSSNVVTVNIARYNL